MLKVEVGQNLNENGFHHYIAYVDELPGRENPIILNLYTNLGGFVNLTSLNEEIHAQFGMENKEFMDYFYSRAGKNIRNHINKRKSCCKERCKRITELLKRSPHA